MATLNSSQCVLIFLKSCQNLLCWRSSSEPNILAPLIELYMTSQIDPFNLIDEWYSPEEIAQRPYLGVGFHITGDKKKDSYNRNTCWRVAVWTIIPVLTGCRDKAVNRDNYPAQGSWSQFLCLHTSRKAWGQRRWNHRRCMEDKRARWPARAGSTALGARWLWGQPLQQTDVFFLPILSAHHSPALTLLAQHFSYSHSLRSTCNSSSLKKQQLFFLWNMSQKCALYRFFFLKFWSLWHSMWVQEPKRLGFDFISWAPAPDDIVRTHGPDNPESAARRPCGPQSQTFSKALCFSPFGRGESWAEGRYHQARWDRVPNPAEVSDFTAKVHFVLFICLFDSARF